MGVITAGPAEAKTSRLLHENLIAMELAHKCVGIRSLDIPVLGLTDEKADELDRAVARGRELVELGAEVLILGCGGILGLEEAIERHLGVPVVLPASAALKMCELLIDLKLSNCRRGIHAG
jgi:allantoin racemase